MKLTDAARRLAVAGAALGAFTLTVVGALIGQSFVVRLIGAGAGAFLGGLGVAQLRVLRSTAGARRIRLNIALGWAAFAMAAGATGYGVFRALPDSSANMTFGIVGLVSGLAGGAAAALLEGRSGRQFVVAVAGLALSSLLFALLFRASQATLGLVVASLIHGLVVPIGEAPTERP